MPFSSRRSETASSGFEALERISSFVPDLVILDVMMPEMDGYEVCKKIKEQEEFLFTKILFVSAEAMIEQRLRGFEAGGHGYVSKPFDHDQLLARVHALLRLKATEDARGMKAEDLKLFLAETSETLRDIHELSGRLMPGSSFGKDFGKDDVSRCAQQIRSGCERLITNVEKKRSEAIETPRAICVEKGRRGEV